MIVFDGSGSMAEVGFNQIDEPRIFEAREAVRKAVPDIALHRKLGLIVYGPGGADECSGVDLRFGPIENAAPHIIEAVDALEPEGKTALTQAVLKAAQALDYRNKPSAIVLVTDGKETCGGTPCRLAAELRADGLDTTVHVIGFKVRGDFFAWSSQGQTDYSNAETVSRCLADDTGGSYVSAETVDDLVHALRVTLGCNVLF
ncbi:MAG: vWA domain-containing protein [Aliishimia sp.]